MKTKLGEEKSKAEIVEISLGDFRDKINVLEGSLRIQRKNEVKKSSQLDDMVKTMAEKDNQLLELMNKKNELEVQVKNLSKDVALMKETKERESSQQQTANCKLQNLVYLLTAATEAIKSDMSEKSKTVNDLQKRLTAQLESKDQLIKAQKKFLKNKILALANEGSVYENELCRKNGVIESALIEHMQRVELLNNAFRKLKQRVMDNQLVHLQVRKEKFDLGNHVKCLNTMLEDGKEELKKQVNIISDVKQEVHMLGKSKDKLLLENSTLQEKINDTLTELSTCTNQLEQKTAELMVARQREIHLQEQMSTLTKDLTTTKELAENKVLEVENQLKMEVQERSNQEAALTALTDKFETKEEEFISFKNEQAKKISMLNRKLEEYQQK